MQVFRRFGYGWLAAALALACYLPALSTEFGMYDDYSIWRYEKSSVIFDFPESAHLVAIGRPLGAILLNLQFYLIQKVSDFTISRCCAFSLVFLSALLLMRHLKRRVNLPPGLAACAAVCTFLLPSSELFVFWSTNLVPGVLNVLVALLTYEALDKVQFAGCRGGGALGGIRLVAWTLLAGLLFLCSMCIYPATTMFILVPTFASLVFSPIERWPLARRRVARDVLFVVSGCAVYFLLTRHLLRPVLAQHFPEIGAAIVSNQTGLYQFSVERNVFAVLANFWHTLSVGLVSFFYPLFEPGSCEGVARTVAAILLLVGLWRLARTPAATAIGPKAERGYLLQAGAAMLALLALSQCPVILAAGASGWVTYRVVYPISAMVLLLMFALASRVRLPVRRPEIVACPLPAMMLIAAAALGHWVMSAAAANAHNELSYLREQLANTNLEAVKGVTIIGPQPGVLYAEGPLRSEFRKLASRDFFHGLENVLLEERGVKRGSLPVRHWRCARQGEYSVVAADMAVIDMNAAARGQPAPWSPGKPRVVIRASRESSADGAAVHAFDWAADTFWEAPGPNNWLQVDYGRTYRLSGYSIVPTDPADRMPLDWQVLGSSDGVHWSLLDQRRAEPGWKPGEERRFSLAAAAHYSSYRLVLPSVRRDLVRLGTWQPLREDAAGVAMQDGTTTAGQHADPQPAGRALAARAAQTLR